MFVCCGGLCVCVCSQACYVGRIVCGVVCVTCCLRCVVWCGVYCVLLAVPYASCIMCHVMCVVYRVCVLLVVRPLLCVLGVSFGVCRVLFSVLCAGSCSMWWLLCCAMCGRVVIGLCVLS